MSLSLRATAELAILGVVAAAAGGTVAYILRRRPRRDPQDYERRRRELVNRSGRMGDGYVTDVAGETVYYTYSVRGADYTASQDLTELRELLPENLESIVGPVTVKFLPANPGNSIVVCDNWFGIRAKRRRILLKGA